MQKTRIRCTVRYYHSDWCCYNVCMLLCIERPRQSLWKSLSHLPKQDQSTFPGEEETTLLLNIIMISLPFQDVDLLKQFICPHTGQILEPKRTGMFLIHFSCACTTLKLEGNCSGGCGEPWLSGQSTCNLSMRP